MDAPTYADDDLVTLTDAIRAIGTTSDFIRLLRGLLTPAGRRRHPANGREAALYRFGDVREAHRKRVAETMAKPNGYAKFAWWRKASR